MGSCWPCASSSASWSRRSSATTASCRKTTARAPPPPPRPCSPSATGTWSTSSDIPKASKRNILKKKKAPHRWQSVKETRRRRRHGREERQTRKKNLRKDEVALRRISGLDLLKISSGKLLSAVF